MITLGQVKASSVKAIANCNVDDPQFTLYVNDAVRMLMELGHGGSRGWWGTVKAIDGVAYDGCFVWPSNVAVVLGIRTFAGPLQIKNSWFSFTEPSGEHNEFMRCWNGRPTIEFDGETCLFRSIAGSPTKILATADNAADTGKTVTIYGVDSNGAELTTISGGVTTRGVKLTIGGTASTQSIARVDDVAKDATMGKIHLMSFVNGVPVETLATYSGGDINPKFLYSRIVARGSCAASCPTNIKALVKIGFSAVSANEDILPIDSIDAIKSMVQAIRASEAGDSEGAAKFEKVALRRLVAQVNNRFPLEQFQVSFKPFGNDSFNRVTQGMI